jgi:hypothetical protein
MSDQSSSEFWAAVGNLHREKSLAYRDSWKRRGERISIIANIARKVDRLESIADGSPATPDETLMDTAIDLFVYTLKYRTFLADQDETVAREMFGLSQAQPPYSDGIEGFEVLLASADTTPLDNPSDRSMREATQEVLDAFAGIETAVADPLAAVPERAERASALEIAAIRLLAALRRDAPERYDDFLAR